MDSERCQHENPAKFSRIVSRYVAAADLNGMTVPLTIARVTMEEMITHDNKGRSTKPVVVVQKGDQGLRC